MEAAFRPVVIEERGRNWVCGLGQRVRKHAVALDDIALLVKLHFMRAPRVITMFRVGPALLANVVDDLLTLFFCVAVLVAPADAARHVIHRSRGYGFDARIARRG